MKLILAVFSFFLALAVITLCLTLAINEAGPWWLEREIVKASDFRASVGRVHADPWRGRLEITDAVVLNPSEWPLEDFLDIAEVRIVADAVDLLRRPRRVERVVLHLNAAALVAGGDGRTNLALFNERLLGEERVERMVRRLKGIGIREFQFRLDSVRLIDPAATDARVREIPEGIDVTVRDLDGLEAAVQAVRAELNRVGLHPPSEPRPHDQ